MTAAPHPYKPKNKLRFVTAASLFDGHDAAINLMRRILQMCAAEVIHLGHNRSANDIVTAAIQEDVHGIAITSYQGGHMEFFKYVIDMLKERDALDIKVFGGGGGVIVPSEIKELQDYGVAHIFSPEDGRKMGLKGMIYDVLKRADTDLCLTIPRSLNDLNTDNWRKLSRIITALENNALPESLHQELQTANSLNKIPVIGITGTGGSGKSSLTDEIIRRFRNDKDDIAIAILALDPTKRKTGGALLGDRIRMNAIADSKIYMRSLATRGAETEVIPALPGMIAACKLAGYELIIVETPGIGQGDAAIDPLVDVSIYVMTPEFGAASQLEKIDMLDFADMIVINKFDRKGAQDALRDVRKQIQRNHEAFTTPVENMPVFGTVAAKFNDEGVTAFYHYLLNYLNENGKGRWHTNLDAKMMRVTSSSTAILPPERQRYLAEIVDTIKKYHLKSEKQSEIARKCQQLRESAHMLQEKKQSVETLEALIEELKLQQEPQCAKLLDSWKQLLEIYQADEFIYKIRDREIRNKLYDKSLSGLRIPKIAMPRYQDEGDRLSWLMEENVPGQFPYTAGVFPLKREGEDPGRMFAGEGDPFCTNRRFKLLSEHADAKRLSTAFDSVTLYGCDPDGRPDIYGKIGNSGVSVATIDDMKALFDGFELCDPKTSVSMTINGPAPAILAMFLNTAIDQQLDKFTKENNRQPTDEETTNIRSLVLQNLRGTVQADILKEDQGQNTCIFSTEFSLKMMADVQEYFIQNNIRNFYSVSISGYHIAEAGANPISQLTFTLANAFTYVEAYLARGMKIDDFAPNLSFFFSNGMDPEYAVLGRVARRIWAITMRDKYGANERSQKLKYHVQTSGRSLHAQEMTFNDIRTTLEALIALYDNCNSLHTNAYDEAITTPTPESVRRALAIQLIINKEWGISKNQNPNQGSFIIEELTDLVEQAVLDELSRINERGGVLGAMETGYQRSKIQEESMLYETRKHDGTLPIIGVNTFMNPHPEDEPKSHELQRSTEEEKQSQIKRLHDFQERNKEASETMLQRLKQAAINNENVFTALMDAAKVCSLGQITHAFFEVGGQYRRNM